MSIFSTAVLLQPPPPPITETVFIVFNPVAFGQRVDAAASIEYADDDAPPDAPSNGVLQIQREGKPRRDPNRFDGLPFWGLPAVAVAEGAPKYRFLNEMGGYTRDYNALFYAFDGADTAFVNCDGVTEWAYAIERLIAAFPGRPE